MIKKITKFIIITAGIVFIIIFLLSFPIVIKSPQIQLSSSEKQEIEEIFNINHFSLTNLVPYKITKNQYDETIVRVYQIYQGVPVNEDLVLTFDSNSSLFESVHGHPVPNIPIQTGGTISNADLVLKTKQIIREDNSYYLSRARPINISVKPIISPIVATLKARLKPYFIIPLPLTAELYIYNKNNDGPQNWTIVWIVRPLVLNYPVYIMDANTGQDLYYFNGLIF